MLNGIDYQIICSLTKDKRVLVFTLREIEKLKFERLKPSVYKRKNV